MKKSTTNNRPQRRQQDADLPDIAEIYALAYHTLNSLPGRFQDKIQNIWVRVENFADQDVLDGLKLRDKYDLLGLYQGIPLPLKRKQKPLNVPDIVFLYRGPLIRFARENGDLLPDLVHHVMIHEIAHHFGLPDFEMDWLEQKCE